MAIVNTTCPKCGGPASWHSDDGLTWCNNGKCSEVSVEYPDYKPPSYRGGVGENEPAIKRRRSSTPGVTRGN